MLNNDSQLKELIRSEARKIAEDVYNQKGTQYGVPQVPYHVHNNIDSPTIPALSIETFIPLGEVVTNAIAEGQTVNNVNPLNISGTKSVPTLDLPVIYGHGVGAASQFVGGTSEEGALVLFVTPALVWQLWAYLDGDWRGVDLITSANATIPSGVILPFGGSSAPTGYLLCDGTSYLRTTYASLFTAIGTTFGAADGTHFSVPDLRGQVPAGYKSGDVNFGTLGAAVGSATHTLTINEMPAHHHSENTNGTNALGGGPQGLGQNTGSVSSGLNTGDTGGGAAHSIIQPSLTTNYIIKT